MHLLAGFAAEAIVKRRPLEYRQVFKGLPHLILTNGR
jgi:hypothetical protein